MPKVWVGVLVGVGRGFVWFLLVAGRADWESTGDLEGIRTFVMAVLVVLWFSTMGY